MSAVEELAERFGVERDTFVSMVCSAIGDRPTAEWHREMFEMPSMGGEMREWHPGRWFMLIGGGQEMTVQTETGDEGTFYVVRIPVEVTR